MALIVGTNSYISESDANIYFKDRVFADAWVSSTEKSKFLISAFRLLESSFIWKGDKASEDQVQEFPREDDTSVPLAIINVQCEISLLLLNQGSDLKRPDKVMKHDKTTIYTNSDNVSIFSEVILNLVKDYGKEKVIDRISVINVYR